MGQYSGPIWAGMVFESHGVTRTVTDYSGGRVFFDSADKFGRGIGSFGEWSDFFRNNVTKLLPPPGGDWSAYVPKNELPDTGPKTPKPGEIWAFNNGIFSGVGRYQETGRTLVLAGKNSYRAYDGNEEIDIHPSLGYKWAVRLFEASEAQREPVHGRELGPGWERCSVTTLVCTDKNGKAEGFHSDGASRRPVRMAVYLKRSDPNKPGSCEACAAYHGVFAGPATEAAPFLTLDRVKSGKLPDIDQDLTTTLPTGTMPPNRSEWRVMADLLDKDGEKYLGAPVKASRMEEGRWYFMPSKKGDREETFGAIIRVRKVGDGIVRSKILAPMNDNSYLDTVRDDFRFAVDSVYGESDWRPILAFPDRSLYATTEPKTTSGWERLAGFLASNAGDPPWLGRPVTGGKFEEDQLYFCAPFAGALSYEDAAMNKAPLLIRVIIDDGTDGVRIQPLTGVLKEHLVSRFSKGSTFGQLPWRPLVRLPRPEQYTDTITKAREPAPNWTSTGLRRFSCTYRAKEGERTCSVIPCKYEQIRGGCGACSDEHAEAQGAFADAPLKEAFYKLQKALAVVRGQEAATPPGIKMGDVVRLVSGGPRMVVTVVSTTGEYAGTCWFDACVLKTHSFPLAALVKE